MEKIIIIGAGIAGLSLAYELNRRASSNQKKLQITLIEQKSFDSLLQSQHSCVVLEPAFVVGDAKQKRFNQQAYFSALDFYSQFKPAIWHKKGLIKLANATHLQKKQTQLIEWIDEHPHLSEHAQYLTAAELSRLAEVQCYQSGIYYPYGGLLNPIRAAQSIIEQTQNQINYQFSQPIESIELLMNGEKVIKLQGKESMSCHKLVYAGGFSGLHLLSEWMDKEDIFTFTKGQMTLVAESQVLKTPKVTLSGDGFVSPVLKGNAIFNQAHVAIGSSWVRDSRQPQTESEQNEENLNKANRLISGMVDIQGMDLNSIHSTESVRLNTKLRTPILREMKSHFWLMTALGSRGYQYAPYLARVLAQLLFDDERLRQEQKALLFDFFQTDLLVH